MNIICKQTTKLDSLPTDCLVIPVSTKGKLDSQLLALDKATNNAISQLIKRGDIGKTGSQLLLPITQGKGPKRLLLLGCGDETAITEKEFFKLIDLAVAQLTLLTIKDASFYLDPLAISSKDFTWQCQQLIIKAMTAAYQYTETVSKPAATLKVAKITIATVTSQSTKAAKAAIKPAMAVSKGINTARELGDLPGNICTPRYLASKARSIARGSQKMSTTILDEKKMHELGMHSLLSVSAGSDQPAKLIVMKYSGAAKSSKPQVLVGKGITFDTGGISLKPGAAMDEMKYDMCGAASVLGCMQTIAELEPKVNIIGIVAAAENMPSGRATKPGDVVTSMSGKTIEILNTDAEGRLVLCDALTYAERFNPANVIDIATLTGAIVVALGKHATGLYSNNDELAEALIKAGQVTGDRAWHMPLWEEYRSQLNSRFADIANVGGRDAGSITAASFLSEFTGKYSWAHLDIAGTAWTSGAKKGATGRPVALLTEFLLNQKK